jgi:hypothetical protein
MLGSPRQANALTQAEWETVADSLHNYITSSQYDVTDDGEKGFIHTPAQYKLQVDNNSGVGDGIVCNVGDDMVNRPVLVDNLWGTATLIPGTSLRNNWTNAGLTGGGFSTDTMAAIQAKVNAHREAGFSDDISVY